MIQTYLPLYRKYRPQSFAGLVGQDTIRQTLTNAIVMDKVAHAYLFCGPRGTGKTSTARIFAKSLNCEQGPTAEPCQVCASCTGVAQGQALDVIEFDAASHNGVQDARDLIETCQFAPMAGRYKIYIIDEVHMLSPQAFNALLKTLEEPPERVVFIFATTEAHKVLPTIVSRCQRFDFTRIPQPSLEKHLVYVASQEGIDLQPDATTLIARSAKGGLRDALSLLDQVSVMFQGQAVTATVIRGLMGGISPDTLMAVVKAVTQQDVAGLLATLDQMEKDGIEPARLVAALTEHIRDLMLYAQAPAVIHPDVVTSGQYAEQTGWFAPEHYPQWLHRLSQLDRQLKQTNQPQLWLEVALVELAHRQTLFTLADLAERITQLEAAQNGQGTARPAAPQPAARPPLPPPVAASAPPPVYAPVSPSTQPGVGQAPRPEAVPLPVAEPVSPAGPTGNDNSLIWQAITDRVPSAPTKAMLKQQAFLKSLTETELVVACSSEAIFKTLNTIDKQIHLKQAIKAHFGAEKTLQMIIEKLPKPGSQTPSAQSNPPVSPSPLPSSAPPERNEPLQPMLPPASQPAAPPMPAPATRVAEPVTADDDEPPPFDAPMDAGMLFSQPDTTPPGGHERLEPPLASITPQPVPTDLPVIEADLQASKDYAVKLLQAQPLD